MAMLESTTSMAYAIQDHFQPSFYEGVYRNDFVLAMLNAMGVPNIQAPGGLYHQWHINTTGNTASVFSEGDAAPTPTAQAYARLKVPWVYFWSSVQITGHARDALRNGADGIFDAIQSAMDLAQREITDLRSTTFLGSSNNGLLHAVSASSTYAGQARGSAAWFESSTSSTWTMAGLRALHRAVRSPDKGGSPSFHLTSPTVLELYAAMGGMPVAPATQSNGLMRYNINANSGAPAFDFGHNTTGHTFNNKPVIECPDFSTSTWLMLDTTAQNIKHVIIRPFEVKEQGRSGDTDIYLVSCGSTLVVEQPKWQGIMSSIS